MKLLILLIKILNELIEIVWMIPYITQILNNKLNGFDLILKIIRIIMI